MCMHQKSITLQRVDLRLHTGCKFGLFNSNEDGPRSSSTDIYTALVVDIAKCAVTNFDLN